MKTVDYSLPKAIFLIGPTASGKTSLAVRLYQEFMIEIISVDSALIYRDLNIGTSKPSLEELKVAPHHLINIKDPTQIYSIAEFKNDALTQMLISTSKNRIPLLVGGTMLYFNILLNGLSPLPQADCEIRHRINKIASIKGWNYLYNKLSKIDHVSSCRIHPNDKKRILRALEVFFISSRTMTELIEGPKNGIPFDIIQFVITPIDRKLLQQRIRSRLNNMLDLGFEDEVRSLLNNGHLDVNYPAIRCIGYYQMYLYIKGYISYNEMIDKILFATNNFAKHQITWLKKFKKGTYLIDGDQQIDKLYNQITKIIRHKLQ